MEDCTGSSHNLIYLQPFIHQVGGHSSMLCLDDATVCKPVVERERQFYETLPDSLKSFAPQYHGVVKVFLLQESDSISLAAVSPSKYTPKSNSSLKRLRFRRNGSIEAEGIDAIFDEDQALNGMNHNNGTTSMNPWVLKCHKEYLASLAAQIEADKSPLDFLVLENLTWRFSLPCILDLKMGTRQYGDNDSLAKRQSKMVKVVSTTSGKLGVRIGGMQVYQATTGHFLCRNKFYGRKLSIGGFQTALRLFLHDGSRMRVDILPPLIRRLEELSSTLTSLDSVRLYTTSLLLLYEGEKLARSKTPENRVSMEVMTEEPLVDVRIIDFAHSTNMDMNDSITHTGPDNGFLFGLENILDILREIYKDAR